MATVCGVIVGVIRQCVTVTLSLSDFSHMAATSD
jgi:hypothetical protein